MGINETKSASNSQKNAFGLAIESSTEDKTVKIF